MIWISDTLKAMRLFRFLRRKDARIADPGFEDLNCLGAESAEDAAALASFSIEQPECEPTAAFSPSFEWTPWDAEFEPLAECVECEPLDESAFAIPLEDLEGLAEPVSRSVFKLRKTIWQVVYAPVNVVRALGRSVLAVLLTPVRFAKWVSRIPFRVRRWFNDLPWAEMLMVRKGFVVGLIFGVSVAGTALWGLSSMPYLPGHPSASVEQIEPVFQPVPRVSVPTELAWFFIEFPYLSEKTSFVQKSRHTYVISDSQRHRDYVVILGQKFRRIEIYDQNDKRSFQVWILTPGYRKTVRFAGNTVLEQHLMTDGNLWMWRSPLWNAQHLKIYGLADVWLDSPFKRYSCAGFVHRFLLDAGIHVPIMDAWDMAKLPWMRVNFDEMEPGDIITIRAASREHRRFWHHAITHVGVYIGHGKLIHASTSARNSARSWIRVSDLEDFHGRIDKVLRPPEMR